MATVETVTGPVEGKKLGFTLSHEHVGGQIPVVKHHYPWLVDRDAEREQSIRELSQAKAGGVDSLIELSTPDLERDVELMQEVSQATGVQIVCATGLWRVIPRYFHDRSADEMADVFRREIEVGIGESGIRAGVIKVANDAEGVTEQGEKLLRAAARVSRQTGRPISTHHWAPKEVGRRQVEILHEEGADLDRVCIGHSADTTDADYLEDLLRAGVYLSLDRYPSLNRYRGYEDTPSWQERNATVKTLIDRGWESRLMLGHDYAPHVHKEESPTLYLFLTNVALPALRADGVSEETVDTMMREAPRRFLTGEA